MHDDIQQVLYSEDEIGARVAEIGRAITEQYREAARHGEQIVLICVLRGAAIFMGDLARCIDLPLEMDYMAVSSYGNAASSSGTVTVKKDLSSDIEGKHVIIAEDIFDTGLTLEFLVGYLGKKKPASICIAALLRKDIEGQADVTCDYVGFECPDGYIVGYGLDYAQQYRNLPYIGILRPEVYSSSE